MVESTLTLKFRGVEADLLNRMVETGLFKSKSEAIRSALVKYAIDLNIPDAKSVWGELRSYPPRRVSAEQVARDIQSIEDEI